MLISGILLTLGLSCLGLYNVNNNDRLIVENDKSNNRVVSSNALTMMYETEAGSGKYQVASDTTWPQEGYVFNAELSRCENGSTLTWDDENNRVIMEANTSDKCYVYFDMVLPPTLVEYITTEVYTGTDGDNGLYYHDGSGTYTNADQEAGDNSYKYSGANPNNYVCFGSDEETCPNDNLYRIIGVFDGQVKLIKLTLFGSFAWNSEVNNEWNPEKNIYPNIKNYLNVDYYNTLDMEWQNLISNHEWNVGGLEYNYAYSGPVKITYTYEVHNSNNKIMDIMKIGLIYISDYGYGFSSEYWNIKHWENGVNCEYNWLYPADTEVSSDWLWTPSKNADNNSEVFYIINGRVGNDNAPITRRNNVYPCFYLKSDVIYVSGSGTQTDPLRIA